MKGKYVTIQVRLAALTGGKKQTIRQAA